MPTLSPQGWNSLTPEQWPPVTDAVRGRGLGSLAYVNQVGMQSRQQVAGGGSPLGAAPRIVSHVGTIGGHGL